LRIAVKEEAKTEELSFKLSQQSVEAKLMVWVKDLMRIILKRGNKQLSLWIDLIQLILRQLKFSKFLISDSELKKEFPEIKEAKFIFKLTNP